MSKKDIKISVLDLVPLSPGLSVRDAFSISLALAQHTESIGYNRFWLGELHLPDAATSATSILICYLAENTKSLRLGAGGVMLSNHSHLIIAEQFGTLISLYPERIDLGLGRSPGADPEVQIALRRNLKDTSVCISVTVN
ncbi:LLM class flavin-dependent oxidoreductase [Yersinia enterocolitica]|uniref:LLM class flavin-dependent oxidoreductase n=1 Tax=Yersinia enterocolitica TaxID=630 RepID=UPI001C8ECD3C|nr:LLM class flavin-dependent oxidoreductase [Yersinia enterocolitica]MBX9489230.1 LLM class flavin-dependent oxidoreductase [Yersinia enterocolitica]MBX9494293.1 LLM class flavin-dependent oxidoreductase [Yersinia enterocolitica]